MSRYLSSASKAQPNIEAWPRPEWALDGPKGNLETVLGATAGRQRRRPDPHLFCS